MIDALKLFTVAQDAKKDCLGDSTELELEDAASCIKDISDAATHAKDLLS